MSAYVYILRCQTTGRHYTGSTTDLERRLRDHKRGNTPTTRKGGPWNLVYWEEHLDLKSARHREQEIKSYKGGPKFKVLLKKSETPGSV